MGQKCGCILYTRVHYTRQNMVKFWKQFVTHVPKTQNELSGVNPKVNHVSVSVNSSIIKMRLWRRTLIAGQLCTYSGRRVWRVSAPSSPFHWERKTSLKEMSSKNLVIVTTFSYILENISSPSLLLVLKNTHL